ncbi:MAG TPA: hypothetical protein VML75_27530 [Kofleriaceae bacterium]|nr:hypothetical protein [Kofleriaceae bacterium]
MGGTRREPAPEDPQPQPEAAAEEPAGMFRFQVLADREARWSESRYFRDFAIGHSWVRLIDPAGDVDSWGYWPDLEGGHGVDTSHPWKSIPGRTRHPDTSHVPNATLSYDIDAKAAKKVAKFGNDKVASPGMYNLFTYNCTTFACEMAATAGVPVPSAGTLGIKNPNDLYAGIQAMNADRGLDVMGQAPPSNAPEE